MDAARRAARQALKLHPNEEPFVYSDAEPENINTLVRAFEELGCKAEQIPGMREIRVHPN